MSDFDREFVKFPKIRRLRGGHHASIMEKIDGTNACVRFGDNPDEFLVQSRERFITPENDNFGFAAWVTENRENLFSDLGPGRHFGEWWGKGIQRGYDQEYRHFSLFNVGKWQDADFSTLGLRVVPVVASGPYSDALIDEALARLRYGGSLAAPRFKRPEGIVVYHNGLKDYLGKVLLEKDDVPKSLQGS